MSIQILDGRGRGFLAEVDSEGHLIVDAIQLSELAHTSVAHGLAFSWAAATYDYDASDTILLVKNTSSTRKLLIEQIIISSDTATEVAIHVPTSEVTPSGTTITGRNMNLGSNNVAEATAVRDETNNSQGNLFWTGFISANEAHHVDFQGALILGTNDSIGVDLVTAGTGCACTIFGLFE